MKNLWKKIVAFFDAIFNWPAKDTAPVDTGPVEPDPFPGVPEDPAPPPEPDPDPTPAPTPPGTGDPDTKPNESSDIGDVLDEDGNPL